MTRLPSADLAVAISARPEIDALSGLATRVVAAARGPEAEADANDPFTLALQRYRSAGVPAELGASWRATGSRRADTGPDVAILRKLDRDLLSAVVRYAIDAPTELPAAATEPAEDAPGPRTIGLATDVAALPSLVMGQDGRWHADDARPADNGTPRTRLAGLAGLASRYPNPAAVAARRRPLLDRIGPQAAANAVAARVKTVPPPPAFFPPRAADLELPSPEVVPARDDELLQTVSGGIELVVGPFTRLQELAAFTRALREMQGVEDVSPRQFAKGLVHIRVHYTDTIPLSNRLAQLREFSPSVLSATRTRIELKVEPPDDAPATS
jgi:hypothetical protein